MENQKIGMPLWKKILYLFLLLIFVALGANIWTWDVSIFLSFIITVISIIMIHFFWDELRGEKENMDTKKKDKILRTIYFGIFLLLGIYFIFMETWFLPIKIITFIVLVLILKLVCFPRSKKIINKYCTKCGYELKQSNNFCVSCGEKIINHKYNPGIVSSPTKSISIAALIIFIIILLIAVCAITFFSNEKDYIFSQNQNDKANFNDELENTEKNELLNINIDTDENIIFDSSDINTDTDGDGLTDVEEELLGLNSNNEDTDEDGLFDRDEVKVYLTDPNDPDTDGDGYSDGDEVKTGYNPAGSGRLYEID